MITKISYGLWEGDPTVTASYDDGRMYAFVKYDRNEEWRSANVADVFTKSGVMKKEDFESLYEKHYGPLTMPKWPD